MKNLIKTYFTIIAVLIALTSCEKFELTEQADVFFHVQVNSVELPVWIRGNTKSNKIVLYVNGGPGLTSIDAATIDMFGWAQVLEKKCAMAYYDQRGCGNANGNVMEESLTINQYVQDLDAIVKTIKNKYENTEVYLMGHNFGSFIAANYLIDTARQSNISGWITIDGSFNFQDDLQWSYRREFLVNIAHEEMARLNKLDFWAQALNWATANPVINTSVLEDEWRNFIGRPGEGLIPVEESGLSFRQYLKISFSSSYNPIPAYLPKKLEIVNKRLIEDAEGKNLISEVSKITIPALFLWGRYDDFNPPEMGQEVFDNLGAPESEKTFTLMLKSGHEPFISDPEKFQNEVINFILP